MKTWLTALFLLVLQTMAVGQSREFSIEGHRGARGYLPENTIPSFKKALEQGADTIEIDVVVSGDREVVISHEPWFSSVISLDKTGQRIPADKQRDHNIYKMPYAEIKLYDVGSIGHIGFPMQEKMKAAKPLLADAFTEISKFAKVRKLREPRWNIEIKTEGPKGDDHFHPAPKEFARLVYDVVAKAGKKRTVIVQSFDVRPLRELRKIDPELPIALLVGNKDGVAANLDHLGFDPDTYSPHFSLIDAEMIAALRKRNIKVIPWTVNETADLERMKTFDLDGIITDYPDRAVLIFRKR